MIQENKELLLRDLCARLPYGVRGERIWTAPVSGSPEKGIYVFDTFDINVLTTGYYDCGEYGFREVRNYSFKPYLFPLSSMTEEQYNSLHELGILDNCSHSYEYVNPHIHGVSFIFKQFKTYSLELIEWLNKNHFDYRDLIPRGLAIDCTNLNIY